MQHKEINMTQQYFTAKQINPMEKPIKEMIDMNMKAFQKMSYINPTELFTVSKPEEYLEKSMKMFIQNGHNALDFMHNMFHIMEKNWFSISDNMTSNAQQMMKQVQTVTQHSVKDTMDVGQRAAKKVASKVKAVSKKNVKQAQVISRKVMKDTAKTVKHASSAASSNPKGAIKKPTASKSKSKTSKSTKINVSAQKPEVKSMKTNVSARKPEVKSMKTNVNAQKPEARSMSSYVKETQNTMSKMQPRTQEIRKDSPVAPKPVNKETSPIINKDRPLM